MRESYANWISGSKISAGISVGFAVVTIVMAAISIWQTYEDLKKYYNVSFTPQPRYIVEEEDITGYNKKVKRTSSRISPLILRS